MDDFLISLVLFSLVFVLKSINLLNNTFWVLRSTNRPPNYYANYFLGITAIRIYRYIYFNVRCTIQEWIIYEIF